MVKKPLLAILDNNDQLLCVTREYFDGNLHTFLQGTAAFFSCSVLQKTEMSQHFKVGNKISFVYDEIAYHFDITDMVKNENYVTIQADTLTLELRNEDSAEYKATKAMTFEEYLKVFLFAPDNPTVMGINEVSDKKLQLEWEGSESSVLARLFSLANKFGAEIEFVTRLNRHWGLDKIVLNVYKANDDRHQGIGKNRQDILLEYGNNVETIEIHENIDNLKTAIKPFGKDGLMIRDVVIDEKDSDGNRLFYSPKGDHVIRAVQARDQFRSKIGSDTEGYISKNWSYETDNQNTLAGQALAELKKLSKVELTVTIQAYEKLGIGDTVRTQNKAYQPTLNLSVRVSEQDIYFEEPEKNTTTFTNIEILKSEVDESLLSRVQALIKENKKYEYQLVTDNGTTFKNDQGQTTLTARVLDGTKDITTDVNLSWTKDGEFVGANKSVIVKATDIHAKAVYRYDVLDDNGLSKGGCEVTVVNVDDGSDGQKGADGKTPYVHTAWSWDINGLDRFSTKLPKENLFISDYVYSNNKIIKNGPLDYTFASSWAETFIDNQCLTNMLKPNTTYTIQYTFELLSKSENTIPHAQHAHGTLLLYSTNGYVTLGGISNNYVLAREWKVGTKVTRTETFKTPASFSGYSILSYTMRSLNTATGAFVCNEKGRFFDIKIEEGDSLTTITTNPKDDLINAYPPYTGICTNYTLEAPIDPTHYNWLPNKGKDSYLHCAWSNKEDHSDMVTIYPNPNSLSTQDIPISSNDGSKYPITRTTMTENGESFVRIKRYNQSTMSPTVFSLYNTINVDKSWIGKTIAVSVDVRASKEVTMSNMDCRVDTTTATAKTVHNPNRIKPNKITTKWQRMYTVYNTLPQSSHIRFVPASGYTATNNNELADFYVDHKNWKVEELKTEQTQATPYCLYGAEVKFSYMGTYTDSILESSINPEKYTWQNIVGEKGDATGIYESKSAPSNPYVGMLWRDSSLNPPILKKYNGSSWDIFMLHAENMSVDNLAAITANLGTVRNNYSYTDTAQNTLKGTIELNNSRIVNEGTVSAGGTIVRNYNTTIDPLYFDMSIYDKNTKDVLKQRVSISSTAIQLVDADLGITANLSAQDLLDTGWKNISSNGQCQYRKKFSTVYIRFDGWSWNKTGLIGTLPADCHPKKAMMFLVPCWSTSGTNDNFQLNADGRFERITNRSGTDAFCHLLTLGPV